ncbi:MurR/RpiR family transcriptional regulator [Loigolactobacillus zhaoyuanensis]|uniref:MurR/RpiR family transcriptional regulator n=1 Tax=Loigolactobacillus zhaoyuanensis TaxID=2486017 RepID=A0ABW8UEQ8_9LACO|nr:MurR/RpiR family transcriptional regulator [Loigolactobacillus zhaoyuanensis]
MRFEEVINTNIERLTQTDISILHFIIENKQKCIALKASELAELTYSSTAGLTRLSKRLGFSGFSELRFFLAQELSETKHAKQNYSKLLTNDIQQTLKLIAQTDLYPIAQSISSAHRIYVFGTDWGEQRAAETLARNFLGCNQPFSIIPSITELNWTVQFMTENDLLILISFSGEDVELNHISNQLKLKSIPTLSITPLTKNSLSTKTTYNLYYQTTKIELSDNPNLEYNYFAALELTVDALFRYYVDNIYSKNNLETP